MTGPTQNLVETTVVVAVIMSVADAAVAAG